MIHRRLTHRETMTSYHPLPARPGRTHIMVLSGLCLVSLGASCDGGQQSEPTAGATQVEAAPPADQIETLEGVDVSEMTDGERATWVGVVNAELSPCGEPISVARCVQRGGSCGACVTAARYLARIVMEGFPKQAVAEQYRARFGNAPKLVPKIDGAPVRGAPMATVTIVEFSDFQCPFCGRAHPVLAEAIAELDGRVKLIFKHFPLSGHVRGMPAARAAVAAQRQGKFWQMHDLMFEHQQELGDEQLLGYAKQLGLDMDRFKTDLASSEVQAQIDADKEAGIRLGVDSTPTIIVNGRRFGESPRTLLVYLKEELDL